MSLTDEILEQICDPCDIDESVSLEARQEISIGLNEMGWESDDADKLCGIRCWIDSDGRHAVIINLVPNKSIVN